MTLRCVISTLMWRYTAGIHLAEVYGIRIYPWDVGMLSLGISSHFLEMTKVRSVLLEVCTTLEYSPVASSMYPKAVL